jgi:bifunctional non-homologous end joining protein LigD
MLRPEDIEPMEACPAPAFSKEGWIFELKYDGYRLICGKHGTGVTLLSRKGKDATSWFPEVVSALAALPHLDFIIDAEVCVMDEKGVPDFMALRGLARSRRRYVPNVVLYAFDLLALAGKDLRDLPLLERKAQLRKLIPKGTPGIGYVAHVERTGKELMAAAVEMGMEGVIGKKAKSPYVGGKTRLWLKAKQKGWHDGWERPKRKGS